MGEGQMSFAFFVSFTLPFAENVVPLQSERRQNGSKASYERPQTGLSPIKPLIP